MDATSSADPSTIWIMSFCNYADGWRWFVRIESPDGVRHTDNCNEWRCFCALSWLFDVPECRVGILSGSCRSHIKSTFVFGAQISSEICIVKSTTHRQRVICHPFSIVVFITTTKTIFVSLTFFYFFYCWCFVFGICCCCWYSFVVSTYAEYRSYS